jgi:hypothetical protein
MVKGWSRSFDDCIWQFKTLLGFYRWLSGTGGGTLTVVVTMAVSLARLEPAATGSGVSILVKDRSAPLQLKSGTQGGSTKP